MFPNNAIPWKLVLSSFVPIAFSALICFLPPFLALCHVCKSYYNHVLKEKIKLGKILLEFYLVWKIVIML